MPLFASLAVASSRQNWLLTNGQRTRCWQIDDLNIRSYRDEGATAAMPSVPRSDIRITNKDVSALWIDLVRPMDDSVVFATWLDDVITAGPMVKVLRQEFNTMKISRNPSWRQPHAAMPDHRQQCTYTIEMAPSRD
nr:hypothetical protein Iba_chr01aCG6830 [Ipomoea batatas]